MFALALLLVVGCKKPPEAPAEFDEICVYLYAHAWDEDPEARVAGVDQLAGWLDDEWDGDDKGYQIGPLDDETMDALDDQDRTAEGMMGLALPATSEHTVDESTEALVAVPQDQVFPDTFADYQRTYLSGPDCFVDHTCERMEALEEMQGSFYGGLFTTHSWSHNQYTWVEGAGGVAMVHRNWNTQPPEVSWHKLDVTEQAYLNVLLPRDGGMWRLQAQWTAYVNDIPEATATNVVVGYFKDSSADLDAWLDEN